MGKNRLITDEKSIAKTFNDYFSSLIKHLHTERNKSDHKHVNLSNNPALSAVNKFQNHSSILKIKSHRTYSGFSFQPANYEEVLTELNNLYMSKNNSLERNSHKSCEENLNVFGYIFRCKYMHRKDRIS